MRRVATPFGDGMRNLKLQDASVKRSSEIDVVAATLSWLDAMRLLLSSDIRSEGSIAIVKKFDFDFFYDFWFYITPTF